MKDAGNCCNGGFELISGISLTDTKGLGEFYEETREGFWIYPSADNICALASVVVKELSEPMFFFLEVPCEEDENYFELYYLECTKSVAQAIIKRYGELLKNDGISRFGFGSHKTGEEIYFQSLQRVSVFSEDREKYLRLFKNLGISDKVFTTVSQLFDPDTDDIVAVEFNGETVYDIVENLKSAGLYFDKRIKF